MSNLYRCKIPIIANDRKMHKKKMHSHHNNAKEGLSTFMEECTQSIFVEFGIRCFASSSKYINLV
jgi:hypothetical protein